MENICFKRNERNLMKIFNSATEKFLKNQLHKDNIDLSCRVQLFFVVV